MNFFKRKATWTNAEFIPLKLCIASACVLIGAYFHDFFAANYIAFLVLFIVTGAWSMSLWISK